MGSTYELAKIYHGNGETELSLTEMSCKLDIVVVSQKDDEYKSIILDDYTPDQIRNIALKMIQSASYFTEDPDQFMKDTQSMLNDHHINKIGIITK